MFLYKDGTIRYEKDGHSYAWPDYMDTPEAVAGDELLAKILDCLDGKSVRFADLALVVDGNLVHHDSSLEIAKVIYSHNNGEFRRAVEAREAEARQKFAGEQKGFTPKEMGDLVDLLLESGKISPERAAELKG